MNISCDHQQKRHNISYVVKIQQEQVPISHNRFSIKGSFSILFLKSNESLQLFPNWQLKQTVGILFQLLLLMQLLLFKNFKDFKLGCPNIVCHMLSDVFQSCEAVKAQRLLSSKAYSPFLLVPSTNSVLVFLSFTTKLV